MQTSSLHINEYGSAYRSLDAAAGRRPRAGAPRSACAQACLPAAQQEPGRDHDIDQPTEQLFLPGAQVLSALEQLVATRRALLARAPARRLPPASRWCAWPRELQPSLCGTAQLLQLSRAEGVL